MVITEAQPKPLDLICPDELTTRDGIVNAMQNLVSSDMSGEEQIDHLKNLTERLIAVTGDVAVDEYDRYSKTSERGLQLPHQKLFEQLEDKSVIVTGGTGLIGSKLIPLIKGYNPRRIVSLSRGITTPMEQIEGVEYHNVDIRNADKLKVSIDTISPDVVYHLAAQRLPDLAETEVNRTVTTNVDGTKNIIDALTNAGVDQLIYASTGKTLRPFSPDVYAASKQFTEAILAQASSESPIQISAGRFTHVVDGSNIIRKLASWIENGEVIDIHDPNSVMYVQSAREAAMLLLIAGVDKKPDVLNIHAIRDLGYHINTANVAIGALIKMGGKSPIRFTGYSSGYEEEAYHGLFHPRTSLDISPLINQHEAEAAKPSVLCEEVDVFPFQVGDLSVFNEYVELLKEACNNDMDSGFIKELMAEVSWALWDAKIDAMPPLAVLKAAKKAANIRSHPIASTNKHHFRTDQAFIDKAILLS